MSSSAPANRPTDPAALILGAWGQGLMVGSLVVMAALTIANMRWGVLLHKLILAELILGVLHGTWIFTTFPFYGWFLSTTAIFLFASWSLHNVITWMKTRPFLSRRSSMFFIGTVILVQPFWILDTYSIFAFYNNVGNTEIYLKIRPWEPLLRDPWWLFTFCFLLYVIKKKYTISFLELVQISPRFGVMLCCMCVSLIFILLDILCVTGVMGLDLVPGVDPFRKLSFILKYLSDIVILDDFKTALDRIKAHRMSRIDPIRSPRALDNHRGSGGHRRDRLSEAFDDLESGGIELSPLKNPSLAAAASSHDEFDALSQRHLNFQAGSSESSHGI